MRALAPNRPRGKSVERFSGLVAVLLAAGSVGAITAAAPAFAETVIKSSTHGTERIKLGLNKSVVIDLPQDAYDILVANPAVADAVTRTARRIYLFGKQVGETNIFVFGANGEQIASLDLNVERDVAGLEDYLARFIPGSDIRGELLNDNVVLTGTVETPLDAPAPVQSCHRVETVVSESARSGRKHF